MNIGTTDPGIVAMPLIFGQWMFGPSHNDYFGFQSENPTVTEYYATPNNPRIVPAAIRTDSYMVTRIKCVLWGGRRSRIGFVLLM